MSNASSQIDEMDGIDLLATRQYHKTQYPTASNAMNNSDYISKEDTNNLGKFSRLSVGPVGRRNSIESQNGTLNDAQMAPTMREHDINEDIESNKDPVKVQISKRNSDNKLKSVKVNTGNSSMTPVKLTAVKPGIRAQK